MPVMDGRALFTALRDKGMTMPVIAHTAAPYATCDARHRGFADLLYKPLALDRLREALDAALVTCLPPSGVSSAPGPAMPPIENALVAPTAPAVSAGVSP